MIPEIIIVCFITFLAVHLWFHITNPYSRVSIVKLPYSTSVVGGRIVLSKNFNLRVHSSKFAQLLGYYKSGFLIIQNAYFGSRRAKSPNADGIIRDIHTLRFDPSKPYLISGDQFSVLYTRNLGVF